MQLDSFRTLGRTGLRVSPLTLGTMIFGDASWGADEQTSVEIIDRYLDAGGNALDTANAYADGRSEQLIGRYLAGRPGRRDRLVIATKFAGNLFPGDPNGGGAGRKAVLQQADQSLRRLGTDYIDLYWQHNWDRHTPLEETVSALNDLVRAGKVRYAGLSDTPAWAVARAATIAEFRGWAPVAAIQVEYSLLQRTPEGELFGIARELGLGVEPWSPLAGGVLSGKYSRDVTSPAGAGRARSAAPRLTEKTFALLDALRPIAGELGAPVAAVALAWVRQQAGVTSTIIGARTLEQLDSDLSSLQVTIPDQQLAELGTLTQPQLDFPADILTAMVIPFQQAGTTINDVASAGAGWMP
jgi:aryl-alcohol dehydrogenase-like predicted oxidoreductase